MKQPDSNVATEIVRRVVHDWDPYGLLSGGAPKDEFDREIAAVVRQIHRIHGPQDAAHVFSRVFGSSFERERFEPEHCREVGDTLYSLLHEAGLLSTT